MERSSTPISTPPQAPAPAVSGVPAVQDVQINGPNASQSMPDPAQSPPSPAPGPMHRRRLQRRRRAATALFSLGILLALLLFQAGLYLSAQRGVRSVKTGGAAILLESQPEDDAGLSATQLFADVAPSVVSLTLYTGHQTPGAATSAPVFDTSGSGSGVILSADGYIVTNAHVIHEATIIQVILASGAEYTASLVGTDPQSDLAVIKIAASGLQPATFGDSTQLQVGQRVVALGNAAGVLPGSITQGIVSGIERDYPLKATTGQLVHLKLIQHDAAINPGNSGGALVNAWGQVVGINVAKLESESIENIGFAIPTATAKPIIDGIMAG